MTMSRLTTLTASLKTIPAIPILGWGIVILSIGAIAWLGTIAHADDQALETSNNTDVVGKPVKDLDGKSLGKIRDLVIHWRGHGYAEYAVLSIGGLWGLGEEHVAVPWASLRSSTHLEHFVLNMREDQLKKISDSIVYQFYDRSSSVVAGVGRSTNYGMKGTIESGAAFSVAKSFGMEDAMDQEFNR